MKKVLLLLLITLSSFIFSCKKTSSANTTAAYTCSACTVTPDALAVNDNNSKGIYVGVLIGSTGTIKFDINNAGTTITAVMVIDGVSVNLTAQAACKAGTAYTAPFTGTYNGSQISITFSVGASGDNPTVTSINIPGHASAVFSLAKETSTALIEAYEGTYSTSNSVNGTFNVVLSRKLGTFAAITRIDGTNSFTYPKGTIVNGNIVDANTGAIGVINGDKISGQYTDAATKVVTAFSGKRTL